MCLDARSPACAAIAKRLYGIEVRSLTIHELAGLQERFNVAVLTGVFEHLPELDDSINSLLKILKPGGLLYIEVPDASSYQHWFSAPYQFLSIEHVNYFFARVAQQSPGPPGIQVCLYPEG